MALLPLLAALANLSVPARSEAQCRPTVAQAQQVNLCLDPRLGDDACRAQAPDEVPGTLGGSSSLDSQTFVGSEQPLPRLHGTRCPVARARAASPFPGHRHRIERPPR